MKKETILKTLLIFAVLLGASSFTLKQTFNTNGISLNVKVSRIRTNEGNVHVLLFNQAVGFPANPAKAYKHIKSKAIVGEVSISIDNIPNGTYSIVVFQDKNANEKFDKSWFGSPKEDYGFSNIPDEFCGSPSFQQTSFVVNATANSITVKLINIK